jgi:hypothetical protein
MTYHNGSEEEQECHHGIINRWQKSFILKVKAAKLF